MAKGIAQASEDSVQRRKSKEAIDRVFSKSSSDVVGSIKNERYGQAASQNFEKWALTSQGQDVIRRQTAYNGGDPLLARIQARSVFEESYKNERLRQEANQTRNNTSTRAQTVSNKNSPPTTQKAAAFPNTSSPTEEKKSIDDQTATFGNTPTAGPGAASVQSFNISNFRAQIENSGVLPTHSYLATFAPFRSNSIELNQMLSGYRDKLTLRCENVVLPTVQLLEEENIRRYGYGPVEKVPYGVQFGDLTLTWIADRYSQLTDFFYYWMNSIVMYESRGGMMKTNMSERPGLSARSAYEVGFKDDFACPLLTVNVYNNQLMTVADYIMYDVFPMNIQSINLGWGEENQYQKITVTFAFTDMETRSPVKNYEELITSFETGEASNPLEEKRRGAARGGTAARDGVDNEVNQTLTALASTPFSGIVPEPRPIAPAASTPASSSSLKKDAFGNIIETT